MDFYVIPGLLPRSYISRLESRKPIYITNDSAQYCTLLSHYLFIVVLISSSVSHSDEVMKKKVSCFAKISYAIGTKIKISNKKKIKNVKIVFINKILTLGWRLCVCVVAIYIFGHLFVFSFRQKFSYFKDRVFMIFFKFFEFFKWSFFSSFLSVDITFSYLQETPSDDLQTTSSSWELQVIFKSSWSWLQIIHSTSMIFKNSN